MFDWWDAAKLVMVVFSPFAVLGLVEWVLETWQETRKERVSLREWEQWYD